MKTLRSCLAVALSIFLASTAPAGAVSLYSGALSKPVTLPALPALETPSVAPQSATELPAIPQPPALTAPQAAGPVAAANAPIAQAAATQDAAASLRRFQAAQAAAPNAQAAASLDELFDEGHVRAAIGEYFGAGVSAEQVGVIVARRRARVEGESTDDEMLASMKEAKRTVAEREVAAIKLFVRGGAKYNPATAVVRAPDFVRYDEVQLQEVLDRRGRPTGKHNIFVIKKGASDRIVVSSSHNDKVEEGDGVIDNWTGTTLVTHLYAAEKDRGVSATRIYVSFAREEDGLLGSQYFLASLSSAQRARIEANVNYDTIAIKGGATNSWENNSDQVLLDAADAAVAEANRARPEGQKLSLVRDHLEGGDADSSSFRWQRPPIPAMTIYSGPEDLVFSIIHSARDNFGAFDFLLYKNTYLVALAVLRWLDAHPVASPGNAFPKAHDLLGPFPGAFWAHGPAPLFLSRAYNDTPLGDAFKGSREKVR